MKSPALQEKSIAPRMPEGKGARPSAVASGLAGGAEHTGMHARCLPIICWPVSKNSKACSAQGTGEWLHTCLQKQLWGEGMSLQQRQIHMLAVIL